MGLRVAARISFGVAPLLLLNLAVWPGGCGGTSVLHEPAAGGTGANGTGGDAHGGTGAGGSAPGAGGTGSMPASCATLGEYAGPDVVDWGIPSDESCAGMTEYCFDPGSTTLEICVDAGAPPPATGGSTNRLPLPPISLCPSVRNLCRTAGGCCDDTFALVAGPREPVPDDKGCCYYLAKPGAKGR